MSNEAFKELEPNDPVPEHLQGALVSEIDIIRDTLEVVTFFTEGFFSTVLMCISEISDPQQP